MPLSKPAAVLDADAAALSAQFEKCLAHFPCQLSELRGADRPAEIKQGDARTLHAHLSFLHALIIDSPAYNPRRRRQLRALRRIEKKILRWL